MSVARYAWGWVWLVAFAGCLVVPAVRWRRRLCAGWGWVPSRLVEAVLVWSAAVVICEVLGAFGWFSRWPVLIAAAGVGVAAWPLAPARRPERPDTQDIEWWEPVVALGFGAFVLAQWTSRTAGAFGKGMTDVDTLSYHLPHAARFMQDGWLTHLHFIAPDEASAYNPGNGELAHSLGMLAWHRDPLSLVINLGWLVLLLGAAWCIGRRLGSGALAVGGASIILASPLISSTQAASGMTDTVSVAFLLIAAYLLLVAADARPALPLAGLASGLALGSKLTIVVPFVALSVVVLLLAPRLRWSRPAAALAWFGPAFVTGSFWYLRNVARVGSPIPTLRIGVDGVALPKPPIALERYAFTVAHYAFDRSIWRHWFFPGLHRAFGVLWPVLVLGSVAVAVVVIAVSRGPAVVRGLGAVVIVSVVGYLFTETGAFGPQGQPVLFTANLRYLMPALVLSLALMPMVASRSRLGLAWVTSAVGAVLLVTGLGANAWPPVDRVLGVGVAALAVVVGLALLWTARNARGRRLAVACACAAAVVAAGTGLPLSRRYLQRRYTVAASGQNVFGNWVRTVHRTKVGIAGFFVQYPLYGDDLSNAVQYIGNFTADHAFTDFRTCAAWRRAVDSGGYQYVILSPSFPSQPDPAALAWTLDAGGATAEVLHVGRTHVFRVVRPLDARTCSP